MTDPLGPSRRDLLAASTAGLPGLTSGATEPASGERAQPSGELLYIGTYTEGGRSDGIHLVRMDPRSGGLRLVGSVNAGANPSFLAIHPRGDVLYAVNEVTEHGGKASGAVSAFTIERDTGALTRLGAQSSEGAAPCYVSVDRGGRAVLVANYVGGNVALLPIQVDGALAPASHVAQHSGSGPNEARQEAAHAHCIVADPTNRFALAADLGIDRVLVYRLDLDEGSLRYVAGGDAQLQPGAGPRHIAFHPNRPLAVVANELDSTVTTLRFDAERGALTPLKSDSTLPAGWSGTSYAADIHFAPSGRSLYVSNRGHNSVVVFSVAERTGALALEQVVSTSGDWPRNFSLDSSGRWLLVANQRSGTVVVFARDEESGRLSPTGERIAIPSPVCVRFRAHVEPRRSGTAPASIRSAHPH